MSAKLYRACSLEEIESYIKTGVLKPLHYDYVSLSQNPDIGDIMCSNNHKLILVFDAIHLIKLGAFKVEYTAQFMEEHPEIFYNIINNNVVEMNDEFFGDGDIPGTAGYEDIALIFKDYINSDGSRKQEIGESLSFTLDSEFGAEEEWVIPKIEGFVKNVIDIQASSMNGRNNNMEKELSYLKKLIIETYVR